jgi:hypothetical protein
MPATGAVARSMLFIVNVEALGTINEIHLAVLKLMWVKGFTLDLGDIQPTPDEYSLHLQSPFKSCVFNHPQFIYS